MQHTQQANLFLLVSNHQIQSGQCCEKVVFEIDKRLFDKTERWCAEIGVSFEQLVLAFIRFCACKDNQEALKEWFNPMLDAQSTMH